MTKAAFSVFVFSIYMVLLGILLIAAPNVLFSLLHVGETQEVWIRVAGMLALYLGCYDFLASRQEWRILFRWSVAIRLTPVLAFSAFVILGLAPPILILFGLIDAAGALWTAAALRADARAS